jgi:4'-phosphopantetheinyl transferase
MVEIFATKILAEEEYRIMKDDLLSSLPESSRRKINAFFRASDAQRSLFGELLIRRLLCEKIGIRNSDLKIHFEEKGKPYIQNYPLHFNMSHSGVWVVAAVSAAPVGIDIEQMKRNRLEVARRFFTESEYTNLMDRPEPDRTDYFYTLWTLKESYLKALGRGLTLPLNSFAVRIQHGEYMIDINGNFAQMNLKIVPLESGYKIAICASEPEISQRVILLPANGYPEVFKKL